MKQEHSNSSSVQRHEKSGNGRWASEGGGLARLQEQVIDSARGAYDAIVDVSADTFNRVNRRANTIIRQYPVQAAASALAVGFLFGMMVSRRKS